MFRFLRHCFSILLAASLALSGIAFVPQAAIALRLLRHWNEPDVTARLHLDLVAPGAYAVEAEAALHDDDPELARSILLLAAERRIAVPPELSVRVDEAIAAQGGVIGDVWNGAVYGEADGAAGFAAAVATDLMVVGDVRDLVRQAWAYPDYDPVVVSLAAVGIGLTAASVMSAGTAAPVKLGASVLKLARKTGRLGAALSADLLRLARRALDPEAMDAVARAGRRLDWSGVRAASVRLLRREVTEELGTAGAALGTLARRQGPKGALDTLRAADSTAEITRLGRIAEKSGPAYRGALKLAPRLAKGFAKASRVFVGWALWLLGGVLWLLWAVWTAMRLIRALIRVIARTILMIAGVLWPPRTAARY